MKPIKFRLCSCRPRRMIVVAAGVILTMAAGISTFAKEGSSSLSIKQVMQKAHKTGLAKRVASNAATAEEKLELLNLYQQLAKRNPAKGTLTGWKARTGKLMRAAAMAEKNDPQGAAHLKSALKCCGDCHTAHK